MDFQQLQRRLRTQVEAQEKNRHAMINSGVQGARMKDKQQFAQEKRALDYAYKKGAISADQANAKLKDLKVQYSQR